MAFDLYDTNDNGRIDQKEMEKILVAIYDLKGIKDRDGPNSPKAKTAEIFAKMDTNFSNTLDEQEFIKGCMNDQELRSFLVENQFILKRKKTLNFNYYDNIIILETERLDYLLLNLYQYQVFFQF